jgi:hypothetical protein
LGFPQNPGCITIYKNIYSRKRPSGLHPDSQTGSVTGLFD